MVGTLFWLLAYHPEVLSLSNSLGFVFLISFGLARWRRKMATHSSILAWRIPWTEDLGGLQSTGHKELDTTEQLHFHFSLNGVFPP